MATTIGEAVSADSEAARRLGSLTTRFDAPGIGQLAGHCAVLVATGHLVTVSIGSYWLVLALLAHGFVLVFLFAPLHETIHRTAFRSRWINTAVSWFCGALLMLPPNYFRAFHFAHHRYTQDAGRERRLAWNMPFHIADHVYPGVPFHGLPEVHKRIRDGVRYEAPGYFAVQREIVSRFAVPARG